MTRIVRFHGQSRLPAALGGLLDTGWEIQRAPAARTLPRNGQAIVLIGDAEDRRIRLFAYTVTDSSRDRPHERRVEITNTYLGNLTKLPDFDDLVIAFEREMYTWVGIDNRRLNYGGPKHNASTFLPTMGFSAVPASGILIVPMESDVISSEFAAFFKAESLAEYIFNRTLIHAGSYDGKGKFSGNTVVPSPPLMQLDDDRFKGTELIFRGPASIEKGPTIDDSAIESVQKGDAKTIRQLKLTREELLEVIRRCDEVGLKGERWVLNYERRRLRRAKRPDLAEKIAWVSQIYPYEGYDISSFEVDGTPRYIEVKTTVSSSKRFEMSDNEWRRSEELREKYQIYRVTNVEKTPNLRQLIDPVALLAEGKVSKAASSWSLTYV